MSVEIPDKSWFKIGEVARIVGVKPYVIRYWESEFRALRPAKTKSRQRLFRRRDIELLLVIRRLVHEERFTIDGARKQLRELSAAGLTPADLLDAEDSGVEVGLSTVQRLALREPNSDTDSSAVERGNGEEMPLRASCGPAEEGGLSAAPGPDEPHPVARAAPRQHVDDEHVGSDRSAAALQQRAGSAPGRATTGARGDGTGTLPLPLASRSTDTEQSGVSSPATAPGEPVGVPGLGAAARGGPAHEAAAAEDPASVATLMAEIDAMRSEILRLRRRLREVLRRERAGWAEVGRLLADLDREDDA
ncbi:MAG: MerR family transcriptional regulator [Deltaproteobacteria bacterium]|nr:MAG: MerR family transcriptional regulator [Deltaproteobacteria bacterium]